MNNTQPQIDMFSGKQYSQNTGLNTPPHWYRSRRLLVFLLVFLISLAISLTYVYSRPAVYKSYATLLSPP